MELRSSSTPPPEDDATEAFVRLLMDHRHRIYAYLTKQLVNPADVEDVFQKTSVVLWKKMQAYDPSRSFFHWACGVASYEVRNFLRTQRRKRLCFNPELVDTLAQEAEAEESLSEARLRALEHCMRGLSDRQQGLLKTCYGGSATITEVADAVGRTRAALYKQLERLRRKLMACIRGRLTEGGSAS